MARMADTVKQPFIDLRLAAYLLLQVSSPCCSGNSGMVIASMVGMITFQNICDVLVKITLLYR